MGMQIHQARHNNLTGAIHHFYGPVRRAAAQIRSDGGDAISGGYIYTGSQHSELLGKLIFGDMTTGNIWYSDIKSLVNANDDDPENLAAKYALNTTLREQVEATYKRRGGKQLPLPGRGVIAGPGRVDLRFGQDRSGEIYILTKSDGMIRKIEDVVVDE